MSDREQALELLETAERDLRALKGMLDPETFADEVFGFLAQQAVEKSLKAWLCVLSQPFPFTHDLADLLYRLEEAEKDVGDLWPVVELNPFAVALRYSSLDAHDVPLDRVKAIDLVETVLALAHRAIVETT